MTSTYNPPPVRRCYLCGKNTTLPRAADSFLLLVLKNGRSYNYCPHHWRRLLKYAPALTIEEHRRRLLREEDLKNNIYQKKLGQIISELKRLNATRFAEARRAN